MTEDGIRHTRGSEVPEKAPGLWVSTARQSEALS